MSKACVFFADGLEECEALIVVDVLRRAGVEVTMLQIRYYIRHSSLIER